MKLKEKKRQNIMYQKCIHFQTTPAFNLGNKFVFNSGCLTNKMRVSIALLLFVCLTVVFMCALFIILWLYCCCWWYNSVTNYACVKENGSVNVFRVWREFGSSCTFSLSIWKVPVICVQTPSRFTAFDLALSFLS